LENGFSQDSIDKYLTLFKGIESSEDSIAYIASELKGVLEEDVEMHLQEIMKTVNETTTSEFDIVFDPTLVRGMSYYTGTIFEIEMAEFGSSVAGGGRYDKMIGKFTGNDTPACGFSIGFERIITILMDNNYQVPTKKKKIAYLVEKGVSVEVLCDIMKQAQTERNNGIVVLVARMNKNKKFQKEQLISEGYEEFKEFFVTALS